MTTANDEANNILINLFKSRKEETTVAATASSQAIDHVIEVELKKGLKTGDDVSSILILYELKLYLERVAKENETSGQMLSHGRPAGLVPAVAAPTSPITDLHHGRIDATDNRNRLTAWCVAGMYLGVVSFGLLKRLAAGQHAWDMFTYFFLVIFSISVWRSHGTPKTRDPKTRDDTVATSGACLNSIVQDGVPNTSDAIGPNNTPPPASETNTDEATLKETVEPSKATRDVALDMDTSRKVSSEIDSIPMVTPTTSNETLEASSDDGVVLTNSSDGTEVTTVASATSSGSGEVLGGDQVVEVPTARQETPNLVADCDTDIEKLDAMFSELGKLTW